MSTSLTIDQFRQTLDDWGHRKIPFFFIIDFEQKKPIAFQLDEMDSKEILYDFNGISNSNALQPARKNLISVISPEPIATFQEKFETVMRGLERGDSYLTNLTVKTPIKIEASLKELYRMATARYKLLYKGEFLVFSPEIFIQIVDGKIFSFPMKGTIDAAIPEAKTIILNDRKELAEHVTIVDLIRNDLSMVADDVRVTRFRYVEEIISQGKKLLQVSSEIVGNLNLDIERKFGTIISRLLPAGSVSGAPKDKTLTLIKEAEQESRGFYTGVMGIYDGKIFDSGVMIRYIEDSDGKHFYRSGGGITTQSEMMKEYQEVIDKIYVPVN